MAVIKQLAAALPKHSSHREGRGNTNIHPWPVNGRAPELKRRKRALAPATTSRNSDKAAAVFKNRSLLTSRVAIGSVERVKFHGKPSLLFNDTLPPAGRQRAKVCFCKRMSRNSCKCICCGARTAKAEVTRMTPDDKIVRFRKCSSCKQSYYTIQEPEAFIDKRKVAWVDSGRSIMILSSPRP